jgi:hypothetical protein
MLLVRTIVVGVAQELDLGQQPGPAELPSSLENGKEIRAIAWHALISEQHQDRLRQVVVGLLAWPKKERLLGFQAALEHTSQ